MGFRLEKGNGCYRLVRITRRRETEAPKAASRAREKRDLPTLQAGVLAINHKEFPESHAHDPSSAEGEVPIPPSKYWTKSKEKKSGNKMKVLSAFLLGLSEDPDAL